MYIKYTFVFGINMEYKCMPPRSYYQNKRLSFSHLFFFKNTFYIKYSPTETVIEKHFYQEVQFQMWAARSELRRQYENTAEVLV